MRLNTTGSGSTAVLAKTSPVAYEQPLADQKDVKPSIGQTDGIAATRSLALTSR